MDNTAKISKILREVKKKTRPDIKVVHDADIIVDRINELLKKHKINAECVKGGSIAKGTFLKNDYDIDLFIRFNPAYKTQNISDITEEILKELCSKLKTGLDRIHGSRDYFQLNIMREKKIIVIEVIPVILVHAQNYADAKNITDLSPEHVTWVKRYTSKNPELIEDIRLAKQFCKANKVYGAESYINGFSGHILDILIIHYGSFIELLKAFEKYDAKDLTSPIIIDTEKNLSDPLRQLSKSKITPLIIVDPIQKDRNSAAALSREKLLMFIEASKKFLSKPDRKFFEIKTVTLEDEIRNALKALKLKAKDVHIARIDIDTLDGSKDVVGTKILKAYETLIRQLQLNDFKVLKSDWKFIFNERRAEAYIIIDAKITKEFTQEGPPADAKEDYKKFIDKHKSLGHKLEFKNNRVYTTIPRKFINPKAFIEDIAKKDFISRRFKRLFVR